MKGLVADMPEVHWLWIFLGVVGGAVGPAVAEGCVKAINALFGLLILRLDRQRIRIQRKNDQVESDK